MLKDQLEPHSAGGKKENNQQQINNTKRLFFSITKRFNDNID